MSFSIAKITPYSVIRSSYLCCIKFIRADISQMINTIYILIHRVFHFIDCGALWLPKTSEAFKIWRSPSETNSKKKKTYDQRLRMYSRFSDIYKQNHELSTKHKNLDLECRMCKYSSKIILSQERTFNKTNRFIDRSSQGWLVCQIPN